MNRPLLAEQTHFGVSGRRLMGQELEEGWELKTTEATLGFYADTLGWLEQHHRAYTEGATHDIAAADPVNAIWKLAGESLGLTRALVDLLQDGYTGQTWPTMRAIHEANQLLGAVADPDEVKIADRWLANKAINQSEARDAAQRQAERIAEAMEAAGLEPLTTNVGELAKVIYSGMSKAAHHRREVVDEMVDLERRVMIYGADPRPERRLEFTIFAGTLVQEVLLKVGDALSVLYGAGFYERHLRPMLTRFQEMLDALNYIEVANRLGL